MWPRCRSLDKIHLEKCLFPKDSETTSANTWYSFMFLKLRVGEVFEHLLLCPHLPQVLSLPADPSFSQNESHSAEQGAIQNSPFLRAD